MIRLPFGLKLGAIETNTQLCSHIVDTISGNGDKKIEILIVGLGVGGTFFKLSPCEMLSDVRKAETK